MSKPSVLILGGISSFACQLTAFLFPQDGPAKVGFLRIADKVSVAPATTYIPPSFLSTLAANPLIEYRQANLTNAAAVEAVFEPPPEHPPFTIVYDLTGEKAYDRPEVIHMTQTAGIAVAIGREAAKRKVEAFVRVGYPWVKMSGKEKGGYREDTPVVPDGDRGNWWREASRALAAMPDLNLVLLRIGAEYGADTMTGVVLPRIVCGHIYKHIKQDMKLLWSSDLKIHTVHAMDVCLAMTLSADWLQRVGGRKQADALAGCAIGPSVVDPAKLKAILGTADPKATVVAPCFNIVDDDETTQDKIGSAVAKTFKIKHDYYGAVTALFAKLAMKEDSFRDMVDDANEMHIEAWEEMLSANSPPIVNSPISPYLGAHEFQKNAINLDGTKARKLLGFKPKYPGITVQEVEKIVKSFQDQGLWPLKP